MVRQRNSVILGAVLSGLLTLCGCSKPGVAFDQYDGKPVEVFLEDHELTAEDFDKTENIYRSKELLPFLEEYAGTYEVTCDEEGCIEIVDVFLEDDLENGAEMLEKVLKINENYMDMRGVEDYFSSFQEDPLIEMGFLTGEEHGWEIDLNARGTVYATFCDLRGALDYEYVHECLEEEVVDAFRGVWNLKEGYQVSIAYRELPDEEKAQIQVRFCDSESEYASEFGIKG